MVQLTVWLILVYALLVIAGGIFGYTKVGSKASLISGLVSGSILLVAWFVTLNNPTAGLAIATVSALALLIVFGIRFNKTRQFMPAGLMAGLSLVVGILFASGWTAQ